MASVEEAVRDFIVTNFLFGDQERLASNDESLLAQGIIDSTGVLELVFFLETTYGIQVDASELIPANLDSINKAAAFVERKTAALK